MLRLARRAMTQLAPERLSPADLELDFLAMAAAVVQGLEVVVAVVHEIRGAFLPLGDALCALATALVLVHVNLGD